MNAIPGEFVWVELFFQTSTFSAVHVTKSLFNNKNSDCPIRSKDSRNCIDKVESALLCTSQGTLRLICCNALPMEAKLY